jgi:hypothetical protein
MAEPPSSPLTYRHNSSDGLVNTHTRKPLARLEIKTLKGAEERRQAAWLAHAVPYVDLDLDLNVDVAVAVDVG